MGKVVEDCTVCKSDVVLVGPKYVKCSKCGNGFVGGSQDEAIKTWNMFNQTVDTISLDVFNSHVFADGCSAFLAKKKSNAGYVYFKNKTEADISVWIEGYKHMSKRMTGEEPSDIRVELGPSKMMLIVDDKRYFDSI